MGHGLFTFPFFRERIRHLDHILHTMGCKWSLEDLLSDSKASINDPEYSQTASTALQIAIVDLLRSFGIVPAAVMGHSSGEIAAA
jgi:acyl transferase domain-containing protein